MAVCHMSFGNAYDFCVEKNCKAGMEMEQIIKSELAEQEIRSGVEARHGVLTSRCGEQIIFRAMAEGIAQEADNASAALRLTPCAAALRRNPPLPGANRLPCMADVVRVVPHYISDAVGDMAALSADCGKKLMSAALAYQNRLRVPFALINADTGQGEAYAQYGFHYIYDKPAYRLREGAAYSVPDKSGQLALAHFVNAVLCRRYGLFAIRSAAYYEKLQERLAARGGKVCVIREDGKLKGCFTYTDAETIGEVVFEDETDIGRYFTTENEKRPATMARIVNLSEMLSHISSKGKVTIAIRLQDPVFAQNDGLFIWYLDESGSRMERVDEAKEKNTMRPEITTTIGELTAFFFGYIKLKQNMKFDSIYLSGPAWIHETI